MQASYQDSHIFKHACISGSIKNVSNAELPGSHRDDRRSGGGGAGVLRVPGSAPGENPLHEHAGAPE